MKKITHILGLAFVLSLIQPMYSPSTEAFGFLKHFGVGGHQDKKNTKQKDPHADKHHKDRGFASGLMAKAKGKAAQAKSKLFGNKKPTKAEKKAARKDAKKAAAKKEKGKNAGKKESKKPSLFSRFGSSLSSGFNFLKKKATENPEAASSLAGMAMDKVNGKMKKPAPKAVASAEEEEGDGELSRQDAEVFEPEDEEAPSGEEEEVPAEEDEGDGELTQEDAGVFEPEDEEAPSEDEEGDGELSRQDAEVFEPEGEGEDEE